jgi:predicted enzyme related to lactoylglutathione lyase
VVEAEGKRAVWLPYVEVPDVDEATEAAVRLGATSLLAPREGPAGWRAVVASRDGGPIAFWQPKR